jgi:hypothetical protein
LVAQIKARFPAGAFANPGAAPAPNPSSHPKNKRSKVMVGKKEEKRDLIFGITYFNIKIVMVSIKSPPDGSRIAVIPAQAGIQDVCQALKNLDPRSPLSRGQVSQGMTEPRLNGFIASLLSPEAISTFHLKYAGFPSPCPLPLGGEG